FCRILFLVFYSNSDIYSSPTRRSSDLAGGQLLLDPKNIVIGDSTLAMSWIYDSLLGADADSEEFGSGISINLNGGKIAVGDAWRSEEHTSELQSRENLVCRLLLVKKYL